MKKKQPLAGFIHWQDFSFIKFRALIKSEITELYRVIGNNVSQTTYRGGAIFQKKGERVKIDQHSHMCA